MRIFNNNNIWIFSKYTNTHTHWISNTNIHPVFVLLWSNFCYSGSVFVYWSKIIIIDHKKQKKIQQFFFSLDIDFWLKFRCVCVCVCLCFLHGNDVNDDDISHCIHSSIDGIIIIINDNNQQKKQQQQT